MIKENLKSIVVGIIPMILVVIGIKSCTNPTPIDAAERMKLLTNQLNTEVATTNSGVTAAITQATKDQQMAENNLIRFTKCINMNQAILDANKNLTVNDLLTQWGSIKSAVNCSDLPVTDTPIVTSWTATGATNPVPQRINYNRLRTPNELFLTAQLADHCYPSQTPSQHYKANRRLAWDVVCDFGGSSIGKFVLFAPDFNNQSQIFRVSAVYESKDTGNTVDLTFGNKRFTIGHIDTKLKVWQVVTTGQVIGQTNLSWTTTGYHSHVELWIDGINVPYDNYSKKLDSARKNPATAPVLSYHWGSTFYFTAYNLWDKSQNDWDPCISASGKDACALESKGIRTIALTKDVRQNLWINFWDKIRLVGPCSWVYQVEDEMNCRYRGKPCWYQLKGKWYYHPTGNTLRPGTQYYIKWDIPSCGWGAHMILPA